MKHARIINNIAVDVVTDNPNDLFHPTVAMQFVEVPDFVENGWTFDGADWSAPPAVSPVTPSNIPPIVSVPTFKLLFTSAERIAINNAKTTDPVIADFFSILDDPRTAEINLALQSVQEMLDYLVSQSLLTAERKDEIVSGQLS